MANPSGKRAAHPVVQTQRFSVPREGRSPLLQGLPASCSGTTVVTTVHPSRFRLSRKGRSLQSQRHVVGTREACRAAAEIQYNGTYASNNKAVSRSVHGPQSVFRHETTRFTLWIVVDDPSAPAETTSPSSETRKAKKW